MEVSMGKPYFVRKRLVPTPELFTTTVNPNSSSGYFSLRIPDPALGSYYKKNQNLL
jgi:hypothetical protein